jgi:ligand-binding sensor domain-containing protein
VLFSVQLVSQNISESVNYINYTIKDGLPSNEAYDVFQDSKGFIWIGTDNGVVKYDGKEFKTYTTRDGLTDNTIFRIKEDYKGRIWFMTYNRRLCYLENGDFKPFEFNPQLVKAAKKIPTSKTITDFHIDTLNNVHLILTDFITIDISVNGFTSVKEFTLDEFLNYRLFKSIDQIDRFIIELKTKFNFDKPNTKIIFNSAELATPIHLLIEDSNAFCSVKEGLYIIDIRNTLKPRYLLNQFQITGVLTDLDHGLWCSTLKDGLIYIPNPNLIAYNLPIKKTNQIHGIIPQNGHLVFSFEYEPTHLFKTNGDNSLITVTNENIKLNQIPQEDLKNGIKFESTVFLDHFMIPITAISLIDSSEVLAFSTENSFIILTQKDSSNFPNTNDAYHQHHHQFSIPKFHGHLLNLNQLTFEDIYKKHWHIFNEKNYSQMADNPNIKNRWLKKIGTRVNKIYKDLNNKVWVGTIDGLYLLNLKTESLRKTEITNLQTKRIQDIVASSDGTLFIATKIDGIYIKKDKAIDSISIESGLLSNTINQMLYDSSENQVWVATNNGINILKKQDDKWFSENVITQYDGLKSTDIKLIRLQGNFIYFTVDRIIYKINTNKLGHKIDNSSPYITSFIVNENSISIDSSIQLPYDSNNIQINYHTISYKSQNDIVYKYKLLPINESWQTTTNDNLVFNTLVPDDYTLQLNSINIDGVESEIKTFKFSIIPAFWMTWWFKILIIIIAVFVGYKISIKTIQTYKSQAQFQRTINEMQIISLQSKMNPHFIFNSLNSIQNYILKNEKVNANQYLLEFSRLIRTILQNSDSPTIPLNDELDTLRMYVNLEKKRIRGEFKYNENIASNIDSEHCIIPSLLIQPYIENAIWHGKVYSNPNGEVSLNVTQKDNTLFFEIIDNGIGIKNAEASKINKTKHKSLGTSVTKKRIQLLSELNDKMSDVIISEAFRNEHTNLYVGTRIKFNIPYVTKS